MSETVIDSAYAAMQAAPEDEVAHLAFYERVADAELYLLLEKEAASDVIEPKVIEGGDENLVLAFDTADRLANFAGDVAPYVALSGRVLVSMLVMEKMGMGLNLGVESSETLIPSDAIEWLSDALSETPDEFEARPAEFLPPAGIPEQVLSALDTKLVAAAGLVEQVWLCQVVYDDDSRGHLLAFINAEPNAERALAKSTHEAIAFSGVDAASLDVAFFDADEPAAAAIAKAGLRFELPEVVQEKIPGSAPGMDPNSPPKLK